MALRRMSFPRRELSWDSSIKLQGVCGQGGPSHIFTCPSHAWRQAEVPVMDRPPLYSSLQKSRLPQRQLWLSIGDWTSGYLWVCSKWHFVIWLVVSFFNGKQQHWDSEDSISKPAAGCKSMPAQRHVLWDVTLWLTGRRSCKTLLILFVHFAIFICRSNVANPQSGLHKEQNNKIISKRRQLETAILNKISSLVRILRSLQLATTVLQP